MIVLQILTAIAMTGALVLMAVSVGSGQTGLVIVQGVCFVALAALLCFQTTIRKGRSR
jgi:hypothetical protein